jgi:hypothetical protein
VAPGPGGCLGLSFWPALGVSLVTLLTGAVLAATLAVDFVRRWRADAARRWRATLDSYADREIARGRGAQRLSQLLTHARGAVARPADRPAARNGFKEDSSC